ncbi:MAG: cyclic lactone autoinducer peptide [Firmicutes bacterium]|nr:cyclic lactone autoinducer peptide [Bacillota bacterium]
MKKLILSAIVASLAVIASASVAGACWLWGYQPKTPACLEK